MNDPFSSSKGFLKLFCGDCGQRAKRSVRQNRTLGRIVPIPGEFGFPPELEGESPFWPFNPSRHGLAGFRRYE